MAPQKSKILIIGGTSYIGKFIVEASAKEEHATFALVREGTLSDPVKTTLLNSFKSAGVTLVCGDMYDHGSLVEAIKKVDVVISIVGHFQLADQTKIIAAIKEAGNVKRFLPSEFGIDVDRTTAIEPALSAFKAKSAIRRAVEAEGIPYTYVSSNCFAGIYLKTFAQPGLMAPPPPKDRLIIMGDGNAKAVYNKEEDIGRYTIKAMDDPRTLNKRLYIRPPLNTFTFNELVSLWETKIGNTLEKIYVPEDKIIKDIQEAPTPINVFKAINHALFVKGDSCLEFDSVTTLEASELYPYINYTTVDEYLTQFM